MTRNEAIAEVEKAVSGFAFGDARWFTMADAWTAAEWHVTRAKREPRLEPVLAADPRLAEFAEALS